MGKCSSRFLLPHFFSTPSKFIQIWQSAGVVSHFHPRLQANGNRNPMYSFPCPSHLDLRRASSLAGNEMSLCMPKSKIRGQPCQLAWSWHAPRKHLSLCAGLDFPSLASWFFLHTDIALCVKAEWTMVRQQQNKLTASVHSHMLLCVSFAAISHAKEEGFNPGDKAQS